MLWEMVLIKSQNQEHSLESSSKNKLSFQAFVAGRQEREREENK